MEGNIFCAYFCLSKNLLFFEKYEGVNVSTSFTPHHAGEKKRSLQILYLFSWEVRDFWYIRNSVILYPQIVATLITCSFLLLQNSFPSIVHFLHEACFTFSDILKNPRHLLSLYFMYRFLKHPITICMGVSMFIGIQSSHIDFVSLL